MNANDVLCWQTLKWATTLARVESVSTVEQSRLHSGAEMGQVALFFILIIVFIIMIMMLIMIDKHIRIRKQTVTTVMFQAITSATPVGCTTR